MRVKDIIWRSRVVQKTTIKLNDTKSGRTQYVELEPNSMAERALRQVTKRLQPDDFVFDLTYPRLYKLVQQFLEYFAIILLLTPHSLRAGEATRRKMRGDALADIQVAGRWEHVKTCKGYIDVVFARQGEVLAEEAKAPQMTAADFSDMLAAPW